MKEGGEYKNYYQLDMEDNMDYEEMEDVRLDDEREHHRRMTSRKMRER